MSEVNAVRMGGNWDREWKRNGGKRRGERRGELFNPTAGPRSCSATGTSPPTIWVVA